MPPVQTRESRGILHLGYIQHADIVSLSLGGRERDAAACGVKLWCATYSRKGNHKLNQVLLS
jgi:hypothetical protein